jgi:hypothetical protein
MLPHTASAGLRGLGISVVVGFLLAATVPWVLSQAAGRPSQVPNGSANPPADVLRTLNDASRATYRSAKERALTRGGPVLLVEGDLLVLKYGGTRTAATYTPAMYHDLKSISHVPLALYSLLSFRPNGPFSDSILYDLKHYRAQVVAAREALGQRTFSDDQLRRQRQILSLSLKFLDDVLDNKQVDGPALREFTRSVRPLLTANAAEAAAAQLDALHALVTKWRQNLTAPEWKQLTVVVMGPQLPRKDNLAVQYFARLLGEPGEGQRIIYAEALFDEARALDLLATHRVDTGIGEAFFQDAGRMHRDLLGDAARNYLDKLFKTKS